MFKKFMEGPKEHPTIEFTPNPQMHPHPDPHQKANK